MSDLHSDILQKLESIDNLLEKMGEKLEKIERSITELKGDTTKMNEHIEFVETVYDVVKKPFRKVLSIYYGNEIEQKKLDMIT